MDLSRTITEGYKIWIAGAAALLALLWGVLPVAWRRQLLVATLLIAAVNYARWGTDLLATRLDAYDLLHYYVNAKYIDELGYLDLYPAVILVDHDNDGPFFKRQGPVYMAQDASGHHLEPVAHAVARGKKVREEKFTPERWKAFEHDVLYLQRTLGCRDKNKKGECIRELSDELWEQLINDHGFNGTTGWTLFAEPVARVVPVESLKLLGYLDLVLLGGAVGMVVWAFGTDAALWTTLFLLVTYSTRWPTITWVFLRYDWVACLIGATALIARGRSAPAGVLAGIASTARMFPALWMWGPFVRGLWGLWEGQVRRHLLVLAAAFVLAVVAVQGAATLRYGPGRVAEHFENMMDHNKAEQLSSRRIGLALALATEPWKGTSMEQVITEERKVLIDRQSPLRYGLGAVGVVALGFALRRQKDEEAYAMGFAPFFLFTTASYYYYVARAPLIVVHAANLDRWRHRVGLAMLMGLETFCNWSETAYPGHRLLLIGDLAWGLLAYLIVQIAWMMWESWRPVPTAPTPAQGVA